MCFEGICHLSLLFFENLHTSIHPLSCSFSPFFFYMNHQVKYVLSKYFTLCGLFWNMISLSRLTLLNKTNCYSQRLYQLSMTLLSRGYNLCSHPTIHSGILCFFIFVQILCILSQLQEVHICNLPALSREHFLVVICHVLCLQPFYKYPGTFRRGV